MIWNIRHREMQEAISDKEIVEIAYGRAKVRLGAHGARFRVCSSWKAIRARMPETNSFEGKRWCIITR